MKSFWETIKWNFKRKGWQQWTVCLLLGLLCMVIAFPTSKTKEASTQISDHPIVEAGTKAELEIKLENILSSAEGIGKTEVFLMTNETETTYFSDSSEQEVTGILVVAEGAGDVVTERKIQQAVMALFQLEAHKIKVMKMK